METSIAIDGYSNFHPIGTGGFSRVYQAEQSGFSRLVAIKVLNAAFSNDSERRTFQNECQAMGSLGRHPNIVTVFQAAFTKDGRPCIVMELYHGNYRQKLDDSGPLDVPELLDLGVKAAGALQSAHNVGILHRDVKPHNLFLSHDIDEPALGDFGISSLAGERTATGAAGISIAYAPPEALDETPITAQSDVYSLGATLYHLAAGSPPFPSKDLKTTVRKILLEPPPRIARSDVPGSLGQLLKRSMAKDKTDRVRSARELGEGLREIQAELGLDRTSLRTTGHDGPAPTAPSPASRNESTIDRGERIVVERSLPASAKAPTQSDSTVSPAPAAGRDDHTVTVARQRSEVPVPTDEPEPIDPKLKQRQRLGAAAVIAVLALIAAGVYFLGGDGTTIEAEPTPEPEITPDDVFVTLEPPTVVRPVRSAGGTVEVSWNAVDGAVAYDVYRLDDEAPEEVAVLTVETNRLVYEDVPDDGALCVEVVSVGEAGRVSAPSDSKCIIGSDLDGDGELDE